jgi:hypothetical protein
MATGIAALAKGKSASVSAFFITNQPLSMSPIRGDVKEKFFPFLSEGDGRCGLHPAHLSFGGTVGLPRIPD